MSQPCSLRLNQFHSISNRYLLSYVLTLLVDSMRSVRNFHFDKAAASVLTSCVSVLCKCVVNVFRLLLLERNRLCRKF